MLVKEAPEHKVWEKLECGLGNVLWDKSHLELCDRNDINIFGNYQLVKKVV